MKRFSILFDLFKLLPEPKMERIFKVNKSEFYNGTIRFFVSVLLVSLCVSGCVGLFLQPPTPRPYITRRATIQPLPKNHDGSWNRDSSWNKEEVDMVKEVVAAVIKHHGLKKDPRSGGKSYGSSTIRNDYILTLTACFLSGYPHFPLLEHRELRPLEALGLIPKNPGPKGEIYLYVELISFSSQEVVTDPQRLLVESIWHELWDPLCSKFGSRMKETYSLY